MSQRNLEITVQGINGLLCSNVAYSDPLGEYAKYKQFFTDKKVKQRPMEFIEPSESLIGFYLATG